MRWGETSDVGTVCRTDVVCRSTSSLFPFNLLPWRVERSRHGSSTFQLPVTSQPNLKPNLPETLWNIDSSGQSFRGQSFRGQFFSGGRWSSLQCRLLPHTCMRGGIWPFLYNCSLVKHFQTDCNYFSVVSHQRSQAETSFSSKLLWIFVEYHHCWIWWCC